MKTKKGFTLIEMIIAMGVLAIMSTALTGAFSSGFSTYSTSRQLQRDVEDAQYAMNTLEKFLRTSTVLSPVTNFSGDNATLIKFYDYSSKRCFRYRFLAGGTNALQAQWYSLPNPGNPVDCPNNSFITAYSSVTTGHVSGRFYVISSSSTSSPKRMGKVTVNAVVKESDTASAETHIQASASLRDYTNVGL